MDEDPEQLALICPQLVLYARAKDAVADDSEGAEQRFGKHLVAQVNRNNKRRLKVIAAERARLEAAAKRG